MNTFMDVGYSTVDDFMVICWNEIAHMPVYALPNNSMSSPLGTQVWR